MFNYLYKFLMKEQYVTEKHLKLYDDKINTYKFWTIFHISLFHQNFIKVLEYQNLHISFLASFSLGKLEFIIF